MRHQGLPLYEIGATNLTWHLCHQMEYRAEKQNTFIVFSFSSQPYLQFVLLTESFCLLRFVERSWREGIWVIK